MGCTSSQLEEPYTKSNCEKITKPSFSDDYFTQDQKNVLRMSWVHLEKDPVNKGTRIFSKIFEARPQTKALFPFHALSYEDMITSPLFKGHSVRFMHAVGSVIKNLDALDVICSPTLVRLGTKHAWIHNFINEYLEVFKTAIQEVFSEDLGHKSTPEMMDAWNAVFEFIAVKMNEGYEQALQQQTTSKVASFVESDSNSDTNQTSQNVSKIEEQGIDTSSDTALDNPSSTLPNSPGQHQNKAHLNLSPSVKHKSDSLNTHNVGTVHTTSDLELEDVTNESSSTVVLHCETSHLQQSNKTCKTETNGNSKHSTGNGYINVKDRHNLTLSNITPLVEQNKNDKLNQDLETETERSNKSNYQFNNDVNGKGLLSDYNVEGSKEIYNSTVNTRNNSRNGDLLNKDEPTFL